MLLLMPLMLQMLVTTYAFVEVNWWPDLGFGNSRTRALCVVPLEMSFFTCHFFGRSIAA